jgi:hypothetical protein
MEVFPETNKHAANREDSCRAAALFLTAAPKSCVLALPYSEGCVSLFRVKDERSLS